MSIASAKPDEQQPEERFQKVVVRFKSDAAIPAVDDAQLHFRGAGVGIWDELATDFPGVTVRRLCDPPDSNGVEKLSGKMRALQPGWRVAPAPEYHVIDVPEDADPQQFAGRLVRLPQVQFAYVQGLPTRPPSSVNPSDDPLNFFQNYLQGDRIGIDARFAWQVSGGDGGGLQFMDVEKGWILDHQDLNALDIELFYGANFTEKGHGTSVLGIVSGVDNELGGIGIAPHLAAVKVSSTFQTGSRRSYNPAAAIRSAQNALDFGDVLLLEIQTFDNNTFMPIEVEPAIFDEILRCTQLGIVVIEAAGNGSANLDTQRNLRGEKSLDRDGNEFQDSGAIMVGAATSSLPHLRAGGTNFGNRIDCYAWGENIVTAGGGESRDSYTNAFRGTSGASAIVAGAALLIQSLAELHLGQRFSPLELRQVMSATVNGTVPEDLSQQIGVMPDLRKTFENVIGV